MRAELKNLAHPETGEPKMASSQMARETFALSCREPLNEIVGGKKLRSFATALDHVDSEIFSDEKIGRSDLLTLVGDPGIDTPTLCAAILAWGGMHSRHSIMLFKQSEWLDIANDIKTGRLRRDKAYHQFRELRKDGRLKGMGPAYFTKLIHFLTPRQKSSAIGYIMDQWVGCSVNLLSPSRLVLMNSNHHWVRGRGNIEPERRSTFNVSDENTAKNYEDFCWAIDDLAESLGMTCDDIDAHLFSAGGKKPKAWRQYVKKHRRYDG